MNGYKDSVTKEPGSDLTPKDVKTDDGMRKINDEYDLPNRRTTGVMKKS